MINSLLLLEKNLAAWTRLNADGQQDQANIDEVVGLASYHQTRRIVSASENRGRAIARRNPLHYRSGPFRGKITIDAIRDVQRNTTMWSGFRPATHGKGIIVKYNKYDEIYFSPDSNESFIQALLGVRGAKPQPKGSVS